MDVLSRKHIVQILVLLSAMYIYGNVYAGALVISCNTSGGTATCNEPDSGTGNHCTIVINGESKDGTTNGTDCVIDPSPSGVKVMAPTGDIQQENSVGDSVLLDFLFTGDVDVASFDLYINALGDISLTSITAGSDILEVIETDQQFHLFSDVGFIGGVAGASVFSIEAQILGLGAGIGISGTYQDSLLNTYDFLPETIFRTTSLVSSVPVPAAVWLFGSGLITLLSISRYKKNIK